MWKQDPNGQYVDSDDLLLTGECVPAGVYMQAGGGREVWLDKTDNLPASVDGKVVCYMRINPPRVEDVRVPSEG